MYIQNIEKFKADISSVYDGNIEMFNDIVNMISYMPFGVTLEDFNGEEKDDVLNEYKYIDMDTICKVLKDYYYDSITINININWDTDYESDDLPTVLTLKDGDIPGGIYSELNAPYGWDGFIADYLSNNYGYCVISYSYDITIK